LWNTKWADKYENSLWFTLIWRKIRSSWFGNKTIRLFHIHTCQATMIIRFKKQMHPVFARDKVALHVSITTAEIAKLHRVGMKLRLRHYQLLM
jgi:hypothetical protein